MAEPVNLTEAMLLARDQATQPWHQVGVLLVDGDPPPLDRLAALIGQRIAYAPRFRRKLAGTGVQEWIDDRGFKVTGHLRSQQLPAGGRMEDVIEGLLAEPLERLHPLWDARVIDRVADGQWALVVRSHPALVDGRDNVHLVQELLDEQPTPITGDVPEWQPAVEQASGFAGVLRNLDNPLRALREAAAGLGGLAENGLRQVAVTPAPRYVAAVECSLADLQRVAARQACTVHDVVLTLVTGGVRGWQAAQRQALIDPVALVPLAVDDDGTSAIGCAVAPQYIQLPVTAPTVLTRLEAIATLTQARVDSDRLVGAGELIDLAGFAPPTLHAVAAATVQAGRSHAVFVANVPGPAGERWLGEQRVHAYHAFASTVDDQQFTVGVTSLNGRIAFAASAAAPLPTFARDVADELGIMNLEG